MGGTTAVAHGGDPLWRRCLPKTALPPQDRAASLPRKNAHSTDAIAILIT
ncbi:MAG: hypothetical protein F6K65_39490 [Moorea sp. SIO3C2]|nr:hypothetical protein [Moorena sp. SIO3C2]